MPDASYVQTSFVGGEVSKLAQGRIDRPDYRTLMNVCLNGLPLATGAWVRRGGTRCRAVTRGGAAGRVQGFDFKAGSPYTIEFTDGFLRFFNDTQLVMTNDQVAVSAISAANPAEVTTAANHGWSSDNTAYFNSLGVNNPLLQTRPVKITVTAANKFTIADAVTGVTIDGATLGAFVSGNVTRVLEMTSPYGGGSWAGVRVIRADIPVPQGTVPGALMLQTSTRPYLLKVSTVPTASLFATFSLAAAVFKDGPYLDAPTSGVQITPSATNGLVALTLGFAAYDAFRAYSLGDYSSFAGVNYKSITDANQGNQPNTHPANWTPTAASDPIGPNGFQTTDIGRHVRLDSEPAIWNSATNYAVGDVVAYGGSGLNYAGAVYYRSLANPNSGNPPNVYPSAWAIFPTGAYWTWGRITAISNEIDRVLLGSVAVGTLASGGGLTAAFDGVTNQVAAASAENAAALASPRDFSTQFVSEYIGRNYSGATDQQIQQGTLFPSTDRGLIAGHGSDVAVLGVTVNLRGKASAPASPSDGTLLGTSGFLSDPDAWTAPITVVSTDQVTAWKYVWFETVGQCEAPFGGTFTTAVAEVKFSKPPGSSGGASGVTVQILGDPLLYLLPIRLWRLGLYSDSVGWPTCGTYHEGRVWLSGLVGNRIDASVSNDPFNFAPTFPDGTVAPSSAISYTFNAPDINTILWMEPDQLGIVCGTAKGEWLVQASALNNPLTPTSIQAHRVMRHKSADIEPRRTGLTLCAVQAASRALLEFFPDVYSGKFGADDLAEEAKHLTKAGIAELAFTQEVIPVIWLRLDDGSLKGVTYRRKTLSSSQRAEVRGWHRHELGSGRLVESIAAGPSAGAATDALAMVTKDPANSIRHVEVMTDVLDEGSTLADASYVDDALVPTATASSDVTPAPYGGLTLYGLWPLNGQTVTAWLGGLDCGDYTVANGQITVPYGDGNTAGTATGLFTKAFVDSFEDGMPMVVGFSFSSDGQIVRPQVPQETGARNGPGFGKKRRTHQYAIQVEGSQGLYIGAELNAVRLQKVAFAHANEVTYRVNEQFTGIWKDTLDDDTSFDSMLCWRVARPYIVNIAALGGFIQTQDT